MIGSKRFKKYERLAAYGFLALVGLVMFLTVLPSLGGDGYLAAWDAGGHLLKAEFFANELLSNGKLDGWFPTWHGGFVLLQYYPPLLYYLLGPLTLVFQPEFALRIFTASLWVGLLPAFYYLLRSFSLSRLPAAIGSGLLLSLNASFGIGLGALYGVGLLPNGLGFILAIWALGRLKRDLFELRPTGKVVLTGIVLGLLVLAHTFSTYWFLLVSGALAVAAGWGRPKAPVWKRFGLALGIGAALSAYWWVPLLGSFREMGATGTIQQDSAGTILKGLLLAADSGGWPIVLLAASGLIYLGHQKHYRELGFFVAAGLLTLLLSVNLVNTLLPFGGVIGSSQFIRFHAFFALLVTVWAALGIAGAWHLVKRLRPRFRTAGLTAFMLGLVLLGGGVISPTLSEKRGFIRVVDNEPTAELAALADQLDSRLRSGEFVLSEFNWESRFFFGTPHFVNHRLPRERPGTWDLDGNFPEGTGGAEEPVLIASVLGQPGYFGSQRDYLVGRGVRFVISTYPTSRPALDIQPELKRVWTGKLLALYEIKGFDRPFGLPADAATRLRNVKFADGDYRVSFAEPVNLPAGTAFALSHHPWQVVRVDGREVPTGQRREQLSLTGSATGRELTVAYEPPLWVRGSWVVSVAGLFALAVLVARRDRFTTWLSRRARARGRRKPRGGRRR